MSLPKHEFLFFLFLLLLLLSCFSHVRLCDPKDGSPLGSSIPVILQARTLEWVAISFSNAIKWKVKAKSLSRVQLLPTPWTAAYQAPPSMGFSRQEYWSGCHCLLHLGWPKITLYSRLVLSQSHGHARIISAFKSCSCHTCHFEYPYPLFIMS